MIHHADDLDIRIFKELGNPDQLQWNVRETYSSIAGRLGIDEETVRRRLKQAERLGSLPGWKMLVNPQLIGCKAASIHFKVRDEGMKSEVISELRRMDGIVKILNFHGDKLLLTLYYQDVGSLQTKVDHIISVSDSPQPDVWELTFPEPQIKTTSTDWMIIGSMLDDARKSLKVVSESVEVPERTVERRLNKLTEGNAVYLQGMPNFSKFVGLSCVFIIYCPEEKDKRTVDRVIHSTVRRIELANTGAKQYSTFVTLFDNLAESVNFNDWINGLEGVKRVSMGIMKELIIEQEWLQKEIRKRQRAR